LRILLLFLLFMPSSIIAGAWPREKGEVFLSFSTEIPAAPQTRYATGTSLYAEYGLTSRLTVGFDGYLGPKGSPSETYLFLRFPFGKPDRPTHLALSFGLGQKTIPNPWGTITRQKLARIGAAWGMGLKTGWLSVDASVATVLDASIDVPGQSGITYKADFTWGMKPSKRIMLIWQLQTGKVPDGPSYAKFTPSVVWSIGEKHSSQIEIGLIKGLTGDDSQKLKLGFWKRF